MLPLTELPDKMQSLRFLLLLISSYSKSQFLSKIAAIVESHNWIPEHTPLEKDVIDEMIDYLSTITKSL